MPMCRELYPDDWEAIAHAIKTAANWTCQQCGKPCRQPDETTADFIKRIRTGQPSASPIITDFLSAPQRYTLTTAHLDQNPQNNDPTNLKALCAPCHLQHDRPYRIMNTYAKRERHGQLRLLPPELEVKLCLEP